MIKRKIADWMYRFWYKNHSHLWEYVEQPFTFGQAKVKCRLCGKITTSEKLLRQNKEDE